MIQRQRICVGDRIVFQRFENLQAGGFEAGIAEKVCKHAGPFDAVGLPPGAFEGFQQSNAFSVHLADEEGSGIVQASQQIVGMIPVSQSGPGQGTLMTTGSPCQFHLEQKIVGRNHRGTPPEFFRLKSGIPDFPGQQEISDGPPRRGNLRDTGSQFKKHGLGRETLSLPATERKFPL